MALRVTLLGTGNPRPLLERFGPSTLVETGGDAILFDAGRGVTQRLFAIDRLAAVTDVFLTHLHSDHVVGLADLWLTGWIFRRRGGLRVHGPPGTREMCEHLVKAHAFDLASRQEFSGHTAAADAGLHGEDLRPGTVHQGTTAITAIEVDHGIVRPAYGYRIESGGRTVVLSGDTRKSGAVIAAARGCDVLVHEVAAATPEAQQANEFTRQVLTYHTSPEEAGEVFTAAKPRLAVYSHIVLLGGHSVDQLIARTRTTYEGPLEVGVDGMTLDAGDTVEVRRPP